MSEIYYLKELFGLSTKQAVGIVTGITIGVITLALILAIISNKRGR